MGLSVTTRSILALLAVTALKEQNLPMKQIVQWDGMVQKNNLLVRTSVTRAR